MSIFNLCLRKSSVYGFKTYRKWHNYAFLVCLKSINNDYTELFHKHKLKIDMYY